jgi:hypothetical protein
MALGGLVQGKMYRKPPYFMGKTMKKCPFMGWICTKWGYEINRFTAVVSQIFLGNSPVSYDI